MNVYVFDHMDAKISPCGNYRYTLVRGWPGGNGCLVVVMLNPSKADWSVNDPTVTRCIRFAQAWGYNSLIVLNLFAWRGTDPRSLLNAVKEGHDPIGPDNDAELRAVLTEHAGGTVVLGWGSHPFLSSILPARASYVRGMLRELGVNPMCLGHNDDGSPAHPLYIPKNARLIQYGG